MEIIEHQIGALQSEKETWEAINRDNKMEELNLRFKAAKQGFLDKWKALTTAMANQRNAYTDTATATDTAEAKKNVKGAKDPVAQVLTYLSAVREAKVIGDDAQHAYEDAKASLDNVHETMKAHDGDGPGGQYHGGWKHVWKEHAFKPTALMIMERPDYDHVHNLLSLLSFFADEARTQRERLAKLDASAERAMGSKAGISGDY
jgi:hypothetical protein